jgi:hypothetical protein
VRSVVSLLLLLLYSVCAFDIPLHRDPDTSPWLEAAETEEVRHRKEMHCATSNERDNIFKM